MQPLPDIRILVVDDERPVRMLMRVVLEAAGARVLEADNGVTALRMLDLHPDIAAVLTDLNMPQMDGAELVDTLRTRMGSMLPVLVCSALDVRDTRPQLATQATAIVRKPFVPSDLVRSVARMITAARIPTSTR